MGNLDNQAYIFATSRLPHTLKTTRNCTLGTMASMWIPEPASRSLRLQSAHKYLTLNTCCFQFSDETRVTLDRPDGWENGWIYFGDECHQRLGHQQQGGRVMSLAGILGDRLVGPARVPEEVKVTIAAYCNLLKEILDPWLDETPLYFLRNLVFMHNNASPHSSRTTQTLLESYGIQSERLMVTSISRLQLCQKSLVHH